MLKFGYYIILLTRNIIRYVYPFMDLSVSLFTIDPIKAGLSLFFFFFMFACRGTDNAYTFILFWSDILTRPSRLSCYYFFSLLILRP